MAYKLTFIGSKEALLAAKFVAETYKHSYPKVTYRVLKTDSTLVDPTYGDARRVDRVYQDYPMNMEPVYNPEDMGLSGFGIDRKRQIMFHAATYIFHNLGITPKQGDEVIWEGDHYEVVTFKPKSDSEIGKTNFFAEFELVANIPPPDIRG